LLLDAIQQRDAPRAVVLAQRCVHRHGMSTLETLLVRADADAAAAKDGEARSWLFHLLKQGLPGEVSLPSAADLEEGCNPPPASPLKRPASLNLDQAEIPFPPSPGLKQAPEGESAFAPDPGPTTPVDPAPAKPVDPAEDCPEARSPSEEATLDLEPLSGVEAPEPVQQDEVASPFSAPSPAAFAIEPSPFASTASAREGSLVGASASAALDQAFAPLEIAFPPLPTPTRSEATPPPAKPSPPLPPPFPFPPSPSQGLALGLEYSKQVIETASAAAPAVVAAL